MELCGEDVYVPLAEELDATGGRGSDGRLSEDRGYRAADYVRVVDVGERVTDD